MRGSRDLVFFIRGQASGLPSNTRGRSPVPELGTPGSVRGAQQWASLPRSEAGDIPLIKSLPELERTALPRKPYLAFLAVRAMDDPKPGGSF